MRTGPVVQDNDKSRLHHSEFTCSSSLKLIIKACVFLEPVFLTSTHFAKRGMLSYISVDIHFKVCKRFDTSLSPNLNWTVIWSPSGGQEVDLGAPLPLAPLLMEWFKYLDNFPGYRLGLKSVLVSGKITNIENNMSGTNYLFLWICPLGIRES